MEGMTMQGVVKLEDYEAVNLDCAGDEAELAALEAVYRLMFAYCQAKRKAMASRLAGKITEAITHEDRCQMHYRALPVWARW